MSDDDRRIAGEISRNQAVLDDLLAILEEEVEAYCRNDAWPMVYRVVGLARSYVSNSQGLADSLAEPVVEIATEEN